jgi:uncharacterized protein (TIGR02117 family)
VTRALRITGKALAWLALVVGLFFLSAWIGSSIPRNGGWQEPDDGVTIMVETNGVHTAIVMPLATRTKDWRTDFPATDLAAPGLAYTHVSVSWGEREVFLNTPSWSDLSIPKAFNAASGGDGLLHVAHYIRPAPSPDHRELTISEAEYARLVGAIEAQVLPAKQRKTYDGYSTYDVFYDAPGTYHLGNTCNQWTSDMLALAGVKTGWWTPFPGGVMKWVPLPGADRR